VITLHKGGTETVIISLSFKHAKFLPQQPPIGIVVRREVLQLGAFVQQRWQPFRVLRIILQRAIVHSCRKLKEENDANFDADCRAHVGRKNFLQQTSFRKYRFHDVTERLNANS
ncbi:hypothetical protein M514_02712, partial [Trichuris suis]